MGNFIWLLYREENDGVDECWGQIYDDVPPIEKSRINQECCDSNWFVDDYRHIRIKNIHYGKDYGIDII